MCYAKPGPRCSGHSLTRWKTALDVAARTGTLDDRMAALVAEDTFDTTPKGQQRLKDMIVHPSTNPDRRAGLEGRLQAAQERRRQQAAAYRDITGKTARADTLGLGDQDTLPTATSSNGGEHSKLASSVVVSRNDQDQFLYVVAVGFTTARPVRPDQHAHTITTWAGSDSDAHLQAAQRVGSRPGVVMVTRSTIISVEL